MSRLYETVEPSVIDEEMLQKAVEEQGPKDEAGKIAKKEGIKFGDVLSLRLDFRNILRIENLWEFKSLTKLQVNNNIIEKIEGLDDLVNLVWLDLSFNNIEVIEGLNNLSKIQDLTLYSNKIKKIENMDALKELHMFSIGSNEIQDIKDVKYLRKFPNLRSLNISNNPVCAEEDFQQFVIAFFPKIDFLDYTLIDKEMKMLAHELFKNKVEEQNEKDSKEELEEEVHLQREKELQLHKEAFVEYMDTDMLFVDLYADDPEGNKLNQLPGVDEMLVTYKEKLVEVCKQLFTFGLLEYEKRKTEVDMFWDSVNEAKEDNRELGMNAIEEFLKDKKKLFTEMQNITDSKLLEIRLSEYGINIAALWDKLMILELQLVDQLEEVIKEFDRNMQELVNAFLENVQAYLTQIRELENIHNEKMIECAAYSLDKTSKNELDEDITEELKMLLVDKDTVMSAVTSSHDAHMLKIDNKEDDIVTRIKGWLKDMIETIHNEEEIKRNRTRVIEINNLIDFLNAELDNIDVFSASDQMSNTKLTNPHSTLSRFTSAVFGKTVPAKENTTVGPENETQQPAEVKASGM